MESFSIHTNYPDSVEKFLRVSTLWAYLPKAYSAIWGRGSHPYKEILFKESMALLSVWVNRCGLVFSMVLV